MTVENVLHVNRSTSIVVVRVRHNVHSDRMGKSDVINRLKALTTEAYAIHSWIELKLY
jgi:hypothetical protein